ncbi:hypothetical protein GP486_000814 [Trichoglossum hirsutum]|uniref:Fcf2 pre-rRNA processing C-terminal domain-containing protein n=1 Tax=Trichoglossum hirsutum TaxID=265104 RepID=A0A9P8LH44_9PEZI|nr:hypothetical protein GP486_000814 [Trichoglossum hirsutum]
MATEFEECQPDIIPERMDGDADDDDLSDQQIRQLLSDAENRLRARPTEHAPKGKLVSVSGFPRIDPGSVPQPYIKSTGGVACIDSPQRPAPQGKDLACGPRLVEDPVRVKERLKKGKKATAGSDWFDLPRTNLTPQLKRDLQLLRLRSVLDPKRHYKKNTSKASQFPEFSQVGTIVEGSTEFYSARLPKRQRKNTFVDEVLAEEKDTGYFGRKYSDIQVSKTSGRRAFYKKLKEKRSHAGKRH